MSPLPDKVFEARLQRVYSGSTFGAPTVERENERSSTSTLSDDGLVRLQHFDKQLKAEEMEYGVQEMPGCLLSLLLALQVWQLTCFTAYPSPFTQVFLPFQRLIIIIPSCCLISETFVKGLCLERDEVFDVAARIMAGSVFASGICTCLQVTFGIRYCCVFAYFYVNPSSELHVMKYFFRLPNKIVPMRNYCMDYIMILKVI